MERIHRKMEHTMVNNTLREYTRNLGKPGEFKMSTCVKDLEKLCGWNFSEHDIDTVLRDDQEEYVTKINPDVANYECNGYGADWGMDEIEMTLDSLKIKYY